MGIKAFICGFGGPALTARERDFFREQQPWGFILFARNIVDPKQVRALTDELREISGRDEVPILIDQEGGRVQRLRPPHWPAYPPGRLLGAIFEGSRKRGRRAAWLLGRLIASDLHRLGINIDCLPVLDTPVAGAHDIIGDRAYSRDPKHVAAIGRAVCDGLLAGGVLPVIKHIPGHGRAGADSHLALPIVDATASELRRSDFHPFRELADMPLAMTAHVVYSQLDALSPATTSRKIVRGVIRKEIGFDGVLMSDDLSMAALAGDYSERTERAFAAGCDLVLHCNGELSEMRAVAAAAPELRGKKANRCKAALRRLNPPQAADIGQMRAEFADLLNEMTVSTAA